MKQIKCIASLMGMKVYAETSDSAAVVFQGLICPGFCKAICLLPQYYRYYGEVSPHVHPRAYCDSFALLILQEEQASIREAAFAILTIEQRFWQMAVEAE